MFTWECATQVMEILGGGENLVTFVGVETNFTARLSAFTWGGLSF
jgi:hypothetical protein